MGNEHSARKKTFMVGWLGWGSSENLHIALTDTPEEAIDEFLDRVERGDWDMQGMTEGWGKTLLVYEESVWEAQPERPRYRRVNVT
jgi:hypothetical protein